MKNKTLIDERLDRFVAWKDAESTNSLTMPLGMHWSCPRVAGIRRAHADTIKDEEKVCPDLILASFRF